MSNPAVILGLLGLWAATTAAWVLLRLRDRRRNRPLTRAALVAIAGDTEAPMAIRIIAASRLHANGWCSCHEVSSADLEWLTSQDGTR